MKNLVFLLLVAGMGPVSWHTVSAAHPSDVDEIVWLGLDYSLVRFIGGVDAFSDLPKIRSHYFRSWNELILLEKDKYDVASAFGAGNVRYEMDRAISRSEARNMEGILQTASYSIDESQVRALVRSYTEPGTDQLGALFVMETLDKVRQQSTMWLVVFNRSSGEILHLKWYSGKAGGFGFRNYWARCYYNVLNSLRVSLRKPV
jgi:hypothetical protein